ncbi:MAG: hypothetical protein ACI9Y7_001419 [Dokdonia sp.]
MALKKISEKSRTATLFFNPKNFKNMKTVLYIMIVLFMGANFASCSTDPIDEEIPVEGTVGEDGQVENDPDEDEEEDDGTN